MRLYVLFFITIISLNIFISTVHAQSIFSGMIFSEKKNGLKIVEVRLEPGHSPVPSPRGNGLTSPCFSSTSQYEITLGGRKLIGSAQRRIGETVLQHGSLLIGPEHKQVVDLMPGGHERAKSAYRKQLELQTISLQEAGYAELGFEDLADGIRSGFEKTLSCELLDLPLSADEKSGVQDLISVKYGTPDWNHRDRSAEVTRRLSV